jgi:hypothetical protein
MTEAHTEPKINMIEQRKSDCSNWTLDEIGFASWSDDIREEIMRIVMAYRSDIAFEPYTAADVVREISEGTFADTVFDTLQSVDALDLIGVGESITDPLTAEKLRRRIVEQTGESMRSVIRRTTGWSHDDLWSLIKLPPVPEVNDALRAKHDQGILDARVHLGAVRLLLAAGDEYGSWTDYIEPAYAQIENMRPALPA